MGTKRDISWRIGLSYFCLLLLSAAILWKVFYIQNVAGKYYRALADSVTTKYLPVLAERGNIYSADGRLLATSLPAFDIRMDLKADGLSKDIFRKNIDSLSLCLSKLFGDKSYLEYKKQLVSARSRGDRYFLLKRSVKYNQLQSLRSFPIFRLGQFKGGLITVQQSKREYPLKELANRTIGYMRDVSVKPVGLEGTFNGDLTGVYGKRLVQKVSGGQFIPINDENEIDPQNGKDVITTLDVDLQDAAEKALERTLIANNADHGCAVVMEVKTGAIKAIANLGRESNGYYIEDYNYAVGESHEPGSTFKLASMIALLEDGYINIKDTVDLESGIHQYWNQTMRDAEHHNLRRVTIESAFEHSSNVGISKLVYQYYNGNPEKYLQHLRDLGLNKKLNIEIPGEQQPYIKNTEDKTFTRYSLPWMSVGYELKVSPLQLLTLYNAVANKGIMMKPYLVQQIQEYGQPVKSFEPQVINQKICSDNTLNSLRILLQSVVDSGTARNIKTIDYSIAGKTGTAQIADDKHGYHQRIYQSSFVGYFPADHPLYSCIVVVNAPSKGIYYGALVAAPVFKELSDKIYATDLDINPGIRNIPITTGTPAVKAGFQTDIQQVSQSIGLSGSAGPGKGDLFEASVNMDALISKNKIRSTPQVPDVRGMGLRDAIYLLENCGLHVNINGTGAVYTQSLNPGTLAEKGKEITITLND
ncbi:MAG: transpeptidase family protein [Chitinophagales bacterium]|nr:transpeptidase family protein [Chitinophagales bacterium]